MDIKRVAGMINILAGVVFVGVGVMAWPRKFYLVIGIIFLLLGFLRLRRSPPAPPTV